MILTEQRRNYLPLRVIKDRLDSGEIDPTGEHRRPNGDGDRRTTGRSPTSPPTAAEHPAAGRRTPSSHPRRFRTPASARIRPRGARPSLPRRRRPGQARRQSAEPDPAPAQHAAGGAARTPRAVRDGGHDRCRAHPARAVRHRRRRQRASRRCTTTTPSRSPSRRASSSGSASMPATCATGGRRPSARRRCSSSSSPALPPAQPGSTGRGAQPAAPARRARRQLRAATDTPGAASPLRVLTRCSSVADAESGTG